MSERWMPRTPRDELVLEAMEAVRAFTDSMDRMYGGVRDDMDMNASDVAALRMLVVRERRGEWVSPHEIASHLSISTASTTKLLDRLSERGHVVRRPHPHDGRSRIVVLTDLARQEFFAHFGQRMRRMRDAMEDFDDDELRAVIRFLSGVGTALEE